MGQPTVEEVEAATSALTGRCVAALEKQEAAKSWVGSITGNNDTVESVAGSLRIIRDATLPSFRRVGLMAVEDESKVSGWADLGREIGDAIDKIDGYGRDATIESVLAKTAAQTATDVKEKVLPALSFGIGFAIVGVLVVGFLIIRSKAA